MSEIDNLIKSCYHTFTAIPNVIYEMGLPHQAIALFCAIRRSAGDEGECWRNTATLGFNAGMGAGSVSRTKQLLLERGLIEIRDKASNRGKPSHVITINPLLWLANEAFFLTDYEDRPKGKLALSWNQSLVKSNPSALLYVVGEPQSSPVEVISSPVEVISSPVEMRKNHEEEPIEEEPTLSQGKIQIQKEKDIKIVGQNLIEVQHMDITATRTSDELYYVIFAPRSAHRYTCAGCGEENEWPGSDTKRRKLSTRTCEECGTKHMIHGARPNTGIKKVYGSGQELDALWDVRIPSMPTLMRNVNADSATLEEFLFRWRLDSSALIGCAKHLVGREDFSTHGRGERLRHLLNACAKGAKKIAIKKEAKIDKAYSPPKEVEEEEDESWKDFI